MYGKVDTTNEKENVMWMNLDQLPANSSMYTVFVTMDDESTPVSRLCTEEIDIVLPTRNEAFYVPNHEDFKKLAEETYGPNWSEMLIVAVANQSQGYMVFEANWDEEGNHEVDPE